jgi:hypothetical protein
VSVRLRTSFRADGTECISDNGMTSDDLVRSDRDVKNEHAVKTWIHTDGYMDAYTVVSWLRSSVIVIYDRVARQCQAIIKGQRFRRGV